MSGWNTIDSDAGVFTELVEKLGVTGVELNDVYSIDSDSLHQLDPLYGVIFLFKWQRQADNIGEYDKDYAKKGIFFAQQTIQDACATLAVINCVMNRPELELGEELGNFKSFTTGFDSEMVGDTIGNSELIRTIHNSFSAPNSLLVDETRPQSGDGDLFHFVAYTPINGYIYELDGLKPYPIRHQKCDGIEQFPDLLPGILQDRIARFGNEVRFSLLALTCNRLELAKTLGDHEGVENEIIKQDQWRKENMLRRHEHTGLVIELLKNISAQKNDDEFERWLKKK